MGGRRGWVGGRGRSLEEAQSEAGQGSDDRHVLLAGGGVMREALNEVARAAELPRASGEAGEGGPPWLAWPVGYEGEDSGARVGDMPEEGRDVSAGGAWA